MTNEERELDALDARNAELRARIDEVVREIREHAATLHCLAFPTPTSQMN